MNAAQARLAPLATERAGGNRRNGIEALCSEGRGGIIALCTAKGEREIVNPGAALHKTASTEEGALFLNTDS